MADESNEFLSKTGLRYFFGRLKTIFVQKESGKGLSTNDYTTAEKTKLSGIEAGAEVNTVTSVNGKTGTVALTASDVGALQDTMVIPSRTSQLTNDSGYLAAETDPAFTASPAHGITAQDILDWNAKSDFSGSYNDLTDKPTMVNTFNGQSGAVTYTAPVSSVDGKTGAVTVIPTGGSTGQVLAKASNTSRDVAWVTPSAGGVTSVNGQTGDVTLSIPSKTSDITNDSNFVADANYVHTDNNYTTTEKNKLAGIEAGAEVNDVTSVNGKTGAVVLDASDVGALPDTTTASDLGAYVKPTGGIPKTDLASAVQTSLGKADTALQTAVTSFNGSTGAVTYTAPVTSVNGATGAVTTPNTTYTISISGNVITLTPSSGTAQSITLPVYNGSIASGGSN